MLTVHAGSKAQGLEGSLQRGRRAPWEPQGQYLGVGRGAVELLGGDCLVDEADHNGGLAGKSKYRRKICSNIL